MESAGMDVEKYNVHSPRKAATSAVSEASVPLATILRAAGWASSHTFANYYKLPIVRHAEFANAVLIGGVQPTHTN